MHDFLIGMSQDEYRDKLRNDLRGDVNSIVL